jgi:hypothetical protein
MVARHVQRLRNEAQARDELVINTPEASDGEAP